MKTEIGGNSSPTQRAVSMPKNGVSPMRPASVLVLVYCQTLAIPPDQKIHTPGWRMCNGSIRAAKNRCANLKSSCTIPWPTPLWGVSDWNSEQRLEARQQSAKISKAPLVRQTQTASLCRRTWHLQFLFLLMDWTRSQHVIWLRQQPQHSLPTVTGPAISVLEETGAVFSMASVGEMSMWLKTCTALGVLHRLPL
jgi:hypothetical protein